MRLAFVFGLITFSVLLVYFEGGLRETSSGERPGLLDTVYYVLITISTVGYGDIVPSDTVSRLTDAIVLNMVRILVITTLVGTAFQLVFKRFQEDFRMKRAIEQLNDHVIVAGFGSTGRAAVDELLALGTPGDQIVVLETGEAALQDASALGVVAVSGDARRESVLRSVAIERAGHILVCPGRDDTAVLIALTARHMKATIRIGAICREQENVRLLERSGTDNIVARDAAGGNILASSTRRAHLAETMMDIINIGGGLKLDERKVTSREVGKHPSAILKIAVLRVYRGEERFDLGELPELQLGDRIVFAARGHGDNGAP